jgi:hypothetical protein
MILGECERDLPASAAPANVPIALSSVEARARAF